MTWHDISHVTPLPHLTSPHKQPHYFIWPPTNNIKTGDHSTTMNGRRPVHSKSSLWGWKWLVTLCTFYRQILSLAYIFWNFRPRLARLYLYVWRFKTLVLCMYTFAFPPVDLCKSTSWIYSVGVTPFISLSSQWKRTANFSYPNFGCIC